MKNILTVLLCLGSLAWAAAPTRTDSTVDTDSVEELLKASVMIRCKDGTGSGVIFKNGETDFVWTAAHVVSSHQQIKTVIDAATGQPKVSIRYADVGVSQPIFEDGRKVGERLYFASIIRFSDIEQEGEDLALLRVYKKRAFAGGIRFLSLKSIPRPGDKLWHIGSMSGAEGSNTLTDGIFSVAGRLRIGGMHNETCHPKVYDQISVPAIRGCSGGGVFLKSTGECVGLLTEGITGGVETPNCIVPARRIHKFAKRSRCEWAVNASIAIAEADTAPTTDRDIPAPKGK